MLRLAPVLLAVIASTLASDHTFAQDNNPKWMQYLQGEWEYDFTFGDTKKKGEVSWRIAADGQVGTGSFAEDDGLTAVEVGGRQADSKSVAVINGYGSDGGYWHIEYTKITDDLRVEGPMHGCFGDGRAHKGKITGGKIDENHCEFHYAGKTTNGESVAWTMKGTRKTSQAMPEHIRKALGKLVGNWQIETDVDGKLVKEKFSAKWSEDENTIHYEGKGESFRTGEPVTFSGILGWDGTKNKVFEQNFDSFGGMMSATHHIKGDDWQSPSTAKIVADGKVQTEERLRTFTWQSKDLWTIVATNVRLDGEAQQNRKTVFRRI